MKMWGKSILKPEKEGKADEDGERLGQTNERDQDGEKPLCKFLAIQESISSIHSQISALRSDLKGDMTDFHQKIRKDIRNDLTEFEVEINRKMSKVIKTQQSTAERVNEMEKRIADLQEWAMNVRDAVGNTLKVQENLQAKLSDLKGRSPCNNLRIYRMPEGCEGSNVMEFVAEFIKSELICLQDIDLHIQRAHRALVSKPSQEEQPRSLVISFLEYRVKEMVL